MQSCRKEIATGDEAVHVYIMPKYKLRRAIEHSEQMERMLQLSLATTFEEIFFSFIK